MANRVSVELNANVKGFVDGMNQASESAKKYETDQRKVADSAVNFRKEFAQTKKEVFNLAAAYAKLDQEARNSDFGKQMKKQLDAAKKSMADMIDMQGDLNNELKNMASDTALIDTLSDGFSALGSTMSAVTGTIGIFTDDTELMTKAITYFTTAQSIAAATTKAVNLLQKESSLMLGVTKVQQIAATAAVELDTAAKGKNVVVTGAATVAQKALNAVAKANPYVLLATAILGVVSALALFTSGSDDAESAQKRLNKTLAEGTQRAIDYSNAMYDAAQSVVNFLSQTGAASWEIENAQILAEEENVRRLSEQYLNLKRAKGESVEDYEKREKEAYDRLKTAQENLSKVKHKVEDNRRAVQHLLDTWESLNTEKEINAAISAFRNLRSELKQGSKEYKEMSRRIEILEKKLPTKTKAPKKDKKEEIKTAINSIGDLEEQVSKLQERAKKGALPKELNDPVKYAAKLAELQKKLKELKIKWGFEKADTKLKQLENEVEKHRNEFILAIDSNDKQAAEAAKKAYKAAQKELNNYKLTIDLDTEPAKAGSKNEAKEKVAKYEMEVDASVKGTPEYYEAIRNLKMWQNKAQEIQLKIDADLSNTTKGSLEWLGKEKQRYHAIVDATVVGSDEWYEALNKVNELTKEEKKIQLAIEISGMSNLEKVQKTFEGLHAIDNVVRSFESLTSAVEEGANAWEIFISVISTVEAIIEGINTVTQICNMLTGLSAAAKITEATASGAATTATSTEAATEAAAVAPATALITANKLAAASYLELASAQIFAAHAAIPYAGVGISAGLIATMLSVQAAAKATAMALAAYEDGGIVGGSSYHGDKILARINSGEMVLNQRQQKNLFDLLDSNAMPGRTPVVQVQGVVSGTDLLIVQKNTNKVRRRTGTQITF